MSVVKNQLNVNILLFKQVFCLTNSIKLAKIRHVAINYNKYIQ